MKKKVMIIDDSYIIRERICEYISSYDSVDIIAEASTIKDALKKINDLKPDIIIIDIRMPDGSGINILEKIQEMSDKPITIMFTAYPFERIKELCLTTGADYFFNKNYEFEKLAELVAAL